MIKINTQKITELNFRNDYNAILNFSLEKELETNKDKGKNLYEEFSVSLNFPIQKKYYISKICCANEFTLDKKEQLKLIEFLKKVSQLTEGRKANSKHYNPVLFNQTQFVYCCLDGGGTEGHFLSFRKFLDEEEIYLTFVTQINLPEIKRHLKETKNKKNFIYDDVILDLNKDSLLELTNWLS